MTFHIITLFPELFDSYLSGSIIGKAIEKKKIKVYFYNPRDYTKNKHKNVDDRPYGGGPGMVLQVQPMISAFEKAKKRIERKKKFKIKTLLFSPGGEDFSNDHAQKYSEKVTDLIMFCGRYEGIDARVKKITRATEMSVGPYVLTGGELPAMTIIDAVTRRIPGVLGKFESLEEERISSHEMYTRPEIFEYKKKKYRVPKVLLSGDHKRIEEWRKEK